MVYINIKERSTAAQHKDYTRTLSSNDIVRDNTNMEIIQSINLNGIKPTHDSIEEAIGVLNDLKKKLPKKKK